MKLKKIFSIVLLTSILISIPAMPSYMETTI